MSALDVDKEFECIVLFDGECNLCDGFVNFIIDRDPTGKVGFASLQSSYGESCIEKYHLPTDLSTMVCIENGKSYIRSTGVLKALSHLGGLWWILSVLLIIPAFLRDLGYDLVGRNRYRLFGKHEYCRMPTPALRQRFVEWRQKNEEKQT